MQSLLALLIMLAPAVGWACSCAWTPPQRHVVPGAATAQVPVDATLRVFLTGGFPPALRARLAEEYRLIGPDGPVALDAAVVHTRLDLKPKAPLTAGAKYRLEAISAYDDKGLRLDDAARLRLARKGLPAPQRVWYPVRQFEAVAAAPSGARSTPEIEQASAGYAYGGGDCGPGTWLGADWRLAEGQPLDVVELEVEGHGVISTQPANDRRRLTVGDLMCNPTPYSLGQAKAWRARVRLVDAQGQVHPSAWRSVSPAIGIGRFRSRPGRPPAAKPAWLDHWFAGAALTPEASAGTGPTGCVYGLSIEAQETIARSGAPRSYSTNSLAARIGGKTTSLVLREEAYWLTGQTMPLHQPAEGGAAAPSPGGGAVVVANLYGDHPEPVTALRVGPTGDVLWKTPLSAVPSTSNARIAHCGGRVIVGWDRRGKGDLRPRLQWALLDAADGKVVRSVTGKAGAPLRQGEGLSVGCMGAEAALVIPSQPRAVEQRLVALISSDGKAHSVGDWPEGGNYDVVAHGQGAMAVFDHDNGVFALALDAFGSPLGVPVRIGAGRKPRIAPLGPHFVVAWEDLPTKRSLITVFGLDGRVADPLHLEGSQRHHTPAVYTEGDAIHAVVGVGRTLTAATLSCRATPRASAPARR